MNRLRLPGDSHYDVLGVSPGASDEEINSAFRQLIDGLGYRVGVPLNRQWLRARQIKDAYAALGDPLKRQAYDESLGRTPESAPWALIANDPATDELVLLEKVPDAPEPVEDAPPPDAVLPVDAALAGSEPEAVVPSDEALAQPEPTTDNAPGPETEEIQLVQHSPPPPDLEPTLKLDEPAPAPQLDDNKRASVRKWGMAAAAAAGLGLVLVSSLGWNRQAFTGEGPRGVTDNAGPSSGAGPGFVDQAPGQFTGAPASGPEQRVAPPGQSPAASETLGRPVELQRGGDGRTMQGAGELAARGRADAPPPAATPTGTTLAAAVTSPVPTEAAEAQAVVPGPASPAARAPAIETASERAGYPGSTVRSPAQWLGGGPTDADNRRGRYQGAVEVQVIVAPSGRVSGCAPVRGSGNAVLDAMTCRLVQERARFIPALDAQGRPVLSQAYTTFVWGRKRRN